MNETVLHIVFAVLVILVAGTQMYFRRGRKAHDGVRIEERGIWMAVGLWVASLCVYPLGFEWFDQKIALPEWTKWMGLAGMAMSIPLSVWVYASLGEYFSARLELRSDHMIVTSGPYRFVRHPMYAVLFLCAIGATLASANMIIAIASATLITAMSLRIKKEESMLVQHFGASYERYMQYTGSPGG